MICVSERGNRGGGTFLISDGYVYLQLPAEVIHPLLRRIEEDVLAVRHLRGPSAAAASAPKFDSTLPLSLKTSEQRIGNLRKASSKHAFSRENTHFHYNLSFY